MEGTHGAVYVEPSDRDKLGQRDNTSLMCGMDGVGNASHCFTFGLVTEM